MTRFIKTVVYVWYLNISVHFRQCYYQSNLTLTFSFFQDAQKIPRLTLCFSLLLNSCLIKYSFHAASDSINSLTFSLLMFMSCPCLKFLKSLNFSAYLFHCRLFYFTVRISNIIDCVLHTSSKNLLMIIRLTSQLL